MVSSATPTTISSDVPPKRKGTLIWSAMKSGQQRNEREEHRTRQRDPRHHLVDVLGRLGARLHARNESALLLEILGQVDRIEDDGRVEVGEEHDQNRRSSR